MPSKTRSAKSPRVRQSGAVVRLLVLGGSVEVAWPRPGTRQLSRVQQLVMEWSHVVRNRSRWMRSKERASDQDARARALLSEIGIGETDRKRLADAPIIRVGIPFASEELHWEMRSLPWEFVLSAGTRDLRNGPVAVSRWLIRSAVAPPLLRKKVLFVESAPGRLASDWNFDGERRLVESCMGAATFERLVSPTRAQLQAAVTKIKPDVVHLAGFDVHQGLALADDPRAAKALDGYLLSEANGIDPVPAEDLARLLAPKDHRPSLVFCNVWNSAARIAPLLVAQGVGCAVGFQDAIDDALAEIFAGNFYRGLVSGGTADAGFQEGWLGVRAQSKALRGTGIVLWSGGSLAQLEASVERAPAAARAERPTASKPRRTLTPLEARRLIAVTVEPEPHITYGLLHNNGDLFRKFVIRKLTEDAADDVQVFVELHANDGTYPFRQSFTLDGPVLDLVPAIRIALTSTLVRTLDEVLRTSLFVEVKWGVHSVFSRTFPVTLDPVDQWTDTDAARSFLPSFVFPRDRGVAAIIKQAEQFVTALRDDPTAGFDGYQALDADLANPAENVDRQVQALWYSVVYKVPASYINPPPTYSVASQRIRTPCEVIGGGFGTCIDLALLLASCFEAVEIYPVVFLLDDHAFPGYWRTDKARERFRTRVERGFGTAEAADGGRGDDAAGAADRDGKSWAFDKRALPAIADAIRSNVLVPIESVGLTGRSSLSAAIADAKEYFEDEKRFLSMLDIQSARELGVTPLPLGSRLHQ